MSDQQTTYAISQLISSLGVKGGRLPGVSLSTYQPVLVMGDFSRTLAAEPLEARGLSGEYMNGALIKVGMAQIHSLAPGGIVIERMRIGQTEYTGRRTPIFIGLPTVSVINEFDADVLNIGGRAVRSTVQYGRDTFYNGCPLAGFVTDQVGRTAAFDEFRLYVPPGGRLLVQSGLTDQPLSFMFVWREIPEPAGGA